jgi:putative thioredoxin
MALDVTDGTFEQQVVERSREVPVVVDFWADWCRPCHLLAPVLERAVADRDGQVVLAKVDVDANPGLADRYGVRSIPAVKAFRNGQVVGEFVGAQSAPSVDTFLDALFEPSPSERLLAELRESGAEPELLEALERDDYERAFELLLGEIPGAEPARRERIRELMVALFSELGQEHPLSERYRRRLASALY